MDRPIHPRFVTKPAQARRAQNSGVLPWFSADCLETLEEIAISGKALFEGAGGEQFDYIPCLNTEAVWTEALCLMVAQELSGWI